VNICFISTYAYTLFFPGSDVVFGGSELQLFLLAKALSAQPENHVNFITYDWRAPGVKPIETAIKLHLLNTHIPFIHRVKFISVIPAVFRLWRLMRSVNADIYQSRSAGMEIAIIALFCRLFRRKSVYMTASSIDVDGTYVKNNGIIGRIFLWGLKHTDLIIAQNAEHQRALTKNYGLSSEVKKNIFPVTPRPANVTKRTILWVSNCQPLKQPELFVSLAARFPQEAFQIILPEHSHHADYYQQTLKLIRQQPNLEYIGKVPPDKIDVYYQQAKLFVNTSTYEGFPNTFLQALNAGTPILSLNVDPDSFLTKYQCGFCAHGDLKVLENNLRELLDHEAERLNMADNGRQYLIAEHDSATLVIKYQTLYQRLIAKTAAPAK
jgi:glycosyltransferase involved in cell wall biosynthesis